MKSPSNFPIKSRTRAGAEAGYSLRRAATIVFRTSFLRLPAAGIFSDLIKKRPKGSLNSQEKNL